MLRGQNIGPLNIDVTITKIGNETLDEEANHEPLAKVFAE